MRRSHNNFINRDSRRSAILRNLLLRFNFIEQHDQYEAKDTVVQFLEKTVLTVEYKSLYDQKLKLTKNLVSPEDYNI